MKSNLKNTKHSFTPAPALSNTNIHSLPLITATLLLLFTTQPLFSGPNFISRRNDTLFNGKEVFRFISFNIPNLHLIEDNFVFFDTNNWSLPTRFEIEDAFKTVEQAGGTVIRQYCLRLQKHNTSPYPPKHITGSRTYSEKALRVMDTVFYFANKYDIKIIVPLLEGPPWWGPKKEFARLRGRCRSFESRAVRDDYKHLVTTILNRKNSITGVYYKNDHAILCWETGNEMSTSASWLKEMAAYIKTIDTNHLVMDGNYGVRRCAIQNPNVDIVTNHFYKTPTWIITHDLQLINGRKAYIIGEWGWSLDKSIKVVNSTLEHASISGALAWSLRLHHRNGGFTWHKGEGMHWPGGFFREEVKNEEEILATIRAGAYTIRNLSQPTLPVPLPPELLPIEHPPFISWQSSAGANRYRIERAIIPDGLWKCIADSFDETITPYRPLYCDTSVPLDTPCRYRITAIGPGGTSAPSSASSPVTSTHHILVDEFIPGCTKYSQAKGISTAEKKAWRYKYDFHRIEGKKSAWVTYALPGNVVKVRIYAFYRKKALPTVLETSPDGLNFIRAATALHTYPYCCANPKDRLWLPALIESDTLPPHSTFIRIRMPGQKGQLGRCEIYFR